MRIEPEIIAQFTSIGLIVSGPRTVSSDGWDARYTIGWQGLNVDGIRLFAGAVVWIYHENGRWFAERQHWSGAYGLGDFCEDFPSARRAAKRALDYFLSPDRKQIDGL